MGKGKLPDKILLKDLDIMKISPDDVVFIKPKEVLPPKKLVEMNIALRAYKEAHGFNFGFMVFNGDTDIGVLRPNKEVSE